MEVSWKLESGLERNQESPDTFDVPKKWKKEILSAGDLVKLIFEFQYPDNGEAVIEVERMWVQITSKSGDNLVGDLANDPYCTDEVRGGMTLSFQSHHIIDVTYNKWWKKWLAYL